MVPAAQGQGLGGLGTSYRASLISQKVCVPSLHSPGFPVFLFKKCRPISVGLKGTKNFLLLFHLFFHGVSEKGRCGCPGWPDFMVTGGVKTRSKEPRLPTQTPLPSPAVLLLGFSVKTLGAGGVGYNSIYQIENNNFKISLHCSVPLHMARSKLGWPLCAWVI